MIRLRLVRGGIQLLEQKKLRIVIDAHTPLFENDHPLRPEITFSQDEIAHAVGFKIDGYPYAVGGKRFEIPRKVVRRGGVLLPSRLIDCPDKLLPAHFFGTFEHHMLKHVREPGFAGFFVPRPCPVPDLERYYRGIVFFEHNDFEAVREPSLGGVLEYLPGTREGKRKKNGKQKAEGKAQEAEESSRTRCSARQMLLAFAASLLRSFAFLWILGSLSFHSVRILRSLPSALLASR